MYIETNAWTGTLEGITLSKAKQNSDLFGTKSLELVVPKLPEFKQLWAFSASASSGLQSKGTRSLGLLTVCAQGGAPGFC